MLTNFLVNFIVNLVLCSNTDKTINYEKLTCIFTLFCLFINRV